MNRDDYTVTLRPEPGRSRAALTMHVPDDFTMAHPGSGSIIEVTVMPMPEVGRPVRTAYYALVQMLVGDMPEGSVLVSAGRGLIYAMSVKVPARQGWNVIASFLDCVMPNHDVQQVEESDNKIVVRVVRRAA